MKNNLQNRLVKHIFRTIRCDSCHSPGNEIGLGAGLLGWDRMWLSRWVRTSDKLLAEKNPTVTESLKLPHKIVMSDLKLSDADVEALITYMEKITINAP